MPPTCARCVSSCFYCACTFGADAEVSSKCKLPAGSLRCRRLKGLSTDWQHLVPRNGFSEKGTMFFWLIERSLDWYRAFRKFLDFSWKIDKLQSLIWIKQNVKYSGIGVRKFRIQLNVNEVLRKNGKLCFTQNFLNWGLRYVRTPLVQCSGYCNRRT